MPGNVYFIGNAMAGVGELGLIIHGPDILRGHRRYGQTQAWKCLA